MSTSNIPAHEADAEFAVIGALLTFGRDAYAKVAALLRPEYFQTDTGRECYALASEAFAAGEDPATPDYAARLAASGYEPETSGKILRMCADSIISLHEAEPYAKRIAARHKRNAARDYLEAANFALGEDDIDGQLRQLIGDLTNLAADGGRRSRTAADVAAELWEYIQIGDNSKRLKTGHATLDKILGGISPGDYVIVAARPGVGKSAFANELAVRFAKEGRKPILFTLEMSAGQLMSRMFAAESGVSLSDISGVDRIRESSVLSDAVKSACGRIKALPLHINDAGACDVATIAGETAAAGADIVIVDYIQLMRGHGDAASRNYELEQVSRELRAYALRTGIPVIAMAQLNREGYERPELRNIKDCGSLEQDATAVIMLWQDGQPEAGEPEYVIFDVRKNRQGETGGMYMEFDKRLMRFRDTGKKYVPKAKEKRGLTSMEGRA